MKVKDIRLHITVWSECCIVKVQDQNEECVFAIGWKGIPNDWYGRTNRTKIQAIALSNRLCDRFNKGQERW